MTEIKKLRAATMKVLDQLQGHIEKTNQHASNYIAIHLIKGEVEECNHARLVEIKSSVETILSESVQGE
jgi:hypothetical protein